MKLFDVQVRTSDDPDDVKFGADFAYQVKATSDRVAIGRAIMRHRRLHRGLRVRLWKISCRLIGDVI
jgi:hypothetical protein